MRSLLSVLLLGSIVMLNDCSKKENPTAPPAVAAVENPEVLGQQIAQVYVAAIAELAEIVKSPAEAAEVAPKIGALKEKTVQQLVAFGKRRETLSEAARQQVDNAVRSGLGKVDPQAFGSMRAAAERYRPTDNDLANTIAGFNTITQYAAFELLKKQAPAEAERLGIR